MIGRNCRGGCSCQQKVLAVVAQPTEKQSNNAMGGALVTGGDHGWLGDGHGWLHRQLEVAEQPLHAAGSKGGLTETRPAMID